VTPSAVETRAQVVHANWSGGGLHVWGELPPNGERTETDDGAHPWTTPPESLRDLMTTLGVSLPGGVHFEDGCVVCHPGAPEPAAFAIQWDAGELGQLTLQTCLLPQRDRPYLLSLELARHRIMLFLTKLEEWQRTETSPDAPEMRIFADAPLSRRRHFVLQHYTISVLSGLASTLMLEGPEARLPTAELDLLKETLVRELTRAA